ncbi:hypothetical protein Pst134EA_032222 [Puccinia striiformis f. sp. tritici]|uniref:uncharacterized protein n=1 Tax=Puccinia striiformis f. sp. tritici TaxID=168172 RepID=UPI0020072556|nr:uncharacterized protein Pst134EA_032222 [Puccinia striiformis f. sp. tritici]KAH9444347.1 hypothetical protein Pst134EA_032222 [Puccinia striiformis f. sp. tritici]
MLGFATLVADQDGPNFSHQAHVDKDQQRFQLLIDEYNSQQRINTPEKFKTIVSEQELSTSGKNLPMVCNDQAGQASSSIKFGPTLDQGCSQQYAGLLQDRRCWHLGFIEAATAILLCKKRRQSAEPLDSSSPRTTPFTSSPCSAVSPFTIAPELTSSFPNPIGTDQWNNPFNFSSGDSSSSSSGSLSPILSPSNVSTDPTSSPRSDSSSPDCQFSPTSYSPCLPHDLQPAELEPSFALSSSLKLFLSKNQPAILGNGSSSPTDSLRSRPSTASTESILSGQFDDAPEDE